MTGTEPKRTASGTARRHADAQINPMLIIPFFTEEFNLFRKGNSTEEYNIRYMPTCSGFLVFST